MLTLQAENVINNTFSLICYILLLLQSDWAHTSTNFYSALRTVPRGPNVAFLTQVSILFSTVFSLLFWGLIIYSAFLYFCQIEHRISIIIYSSSNNSISRCSNSSSCISSGNGLVVLTLTHLYY